MGESKSTKIKDGVLIAPSLLAADLSNLEKEVKALEKAGADVIHFDVMDGHFVPNITFGLPVMESIRKHTSLPFDAHLMISNADQYVDAFAQVGCNWLSVHIEACPHIHRTVTRIKELGMKAGVAINPGTSLQSLDSILPEVDYVLLMSVSPGFGGQKFIAQTYDRLRALRAMGKDSAFKIEIDGGLKKHNIGAAVAAGAEIIVMGTGLFASGDYTDTITSLRKAAGETS